MKILTLQIDEASKSKHTHVTSTCISKKDIVRVPETPSPVTKNLFISDCSDF